jgi:FtsP/CotA-like multicopper oxidase with cupredoxin domain
VTDEASAEGPAGEGGGGAGGMTRRQALVAGAGALGVLALGGFGISRVVGGESSPVRPAPPADVVIRPRPSTVQLGSRSVDTWTYGGDLSGPELRLPKGRPVRIRVDNALPEPTSVHWHGIRLRNVADGVPGLTQEAIAPGGRYLYEFTPPDAGTYFFHSHSGVQLDRGLYGPLIIEAPDERSAPDEDIVLMLDDWLDGTGETPDDRLDALMRNGMNMGMGGMQMSGMGMNGMDMGAGAADGPHTDLAGMPPAAGSLAALANAMEAGSVDPGDVRDYPLHLVNGRPPEDPFPVLAGRGDRLRLRVVNAAADTIYCVFIEDAALTVTHADGQPVSPVATDGIVIGMGERYDAVVTVPAGRRRIIAVPLGKRGRAVAILRPRGSSGRVTAPSAPYSMPRRIVDYADLRPLRAERRPIGAKETILELGMGHGDYSWTIGGQVFDQADPIRAERNMAQRFVMRNRTMMAHPMHLHGHSFRPADGGALKDTILVPPMREVAVDWIPDNPGSWAFHCHNAYHAEAGMMRRVEVG